MCIQSNFTAIIICTTFRLLGWYNRGVLSQLPQENANSHLPEVLLLFTYNVVIAVVVVGDVCTDYRVKAIISNFRDYYVGLLLTNI